jgi:hypothetical protein
MFFEISLLKDSPMLSPSLLSFDIRFALGLDALPSLPIFEPVCVICNCCGSHYVFFD